MSAAPTVRSTGECKAIAHRAAEILDGLRVAAGLSHVELAEQSGVPLRKLRATLALTRTLYAGELASMCEVIGVRASDLFRAAEGDAIVLG